MPQINNEALGVLFGLTYRAIALSIQIIQLEKRISRVERIVYKDEE